MGRLETRIKEVTDWLREEVGEGVEVSDPKTDLESSDHVWVLSSADGKIGNLCVAEGRLAGEADVTGELEEQDWLECVREHTRCRLDSGGTLAPHVRGGGV